MLFGDGSPVDTSWAQYTGTAALGVLGGLVSMYFWAKKMWRADRQAQHEQELRERNDDMISGKSLAEEVKKTAEWQSAVYQRRFDSMEKEIAEVRNAMSLLHAERNELAKKNLIQDAQIQAQEVKIKSQDTKILALEEEVIRLRSVIASQGK